MHFLVVLLSSGFGLHINELDCLLRTLLPNSFANKPEILLASEYDKGDFTIQKQLLQELLKLGVFLEILEVEYEDFLSCGQLYQVESVLFKFGGGAVEFTVQPNRGAIQQLSTRLSKFIRLQTVNEPNILLRHQQVLQLQIVFWLTEHPQFCSPKSIILDQNVFDWLAIILAFLSKLRFLLTTLHFEYWIAIEVVLLHERFSPDHVIGEGTNH